jgi:hypothetical protein
LYAFADARPPSLSPNDIELQVRTCRIEKMDADRYTYLSESDIAELEKYIGRFYLRTRAAGETGAELRDGRQGALSLLSTVQIS